MPIQAKSSLALALLLSTSYLLLSTCGENPQQGSQTGEEVPDQVALLQPSEDARGAEETSDQLESSYHAIPAAAESAPVSPQGAPRPASRSQDLPSPVPAPKAAVPVSQTRPSYSTPKPQPVPVTVATGETIDIEFRQTLSSHTSQAGQQFRVRVIEPVRVGSTVAIPAGASILGEVIEANPAKKIGGRARLSLEFQSLTLANGATYPIEAVFSQAGKSQTGKDAAIIGGATLGGAVLGKQVGGDTGKLIGAVAGGIGGAFAAKKTKGKPVEIPAGTMMILELTRPVTIDVLP